MFLGGSPKDKAVGLVALMSTVLVASVGLTLDFLLIWSRSAFGMGFLLLGVGGGGTNGMAVPSYLTSAV